jgi:metal-responsive CopG/Arc/MetJ family transcriptional regulator
MKAEKRGNTVRRSVALKKQLVEEVLRLAPPEIAGNWNRIVTQALREFVARKKEQEFDEAMARMARDPKIRALSGEISREFQAAEEDGLGE